MTPEERDIMIEQRNMLLNFLATFYPNARQGESLFSVMLGPFPTYTRHRCERDLAYLSEKGYAVRRKVGRRDNPRDGEWRTAMWAATPAGLDVNQQVVEDPTLEV